MAAEGNSLTWSTTHKYGSDSLAHQFPSFQISAEDAKSVKVEARSPSGRTSELSVVETDGVYTCNFTPTEVGECNINIFIIVRVSAITMAITPNVYRNSKTILYCENRPYLRSRPIYIYLFSHKSVKLNDLDLLCFHRAG